jgi:hypothetical protein
MTKTQKKEYYNVIKQALERRYPIIVKDPQSLGLSEDTIDSKIAEAISLLKGENLPEDSDTLKELADKIVANAVNDTTVLNEAKAYTDNAVANLQTTIDVPTQEEVDTIFEVGNNVDPILSAGPTFYFPLMENLDPIGETTVTISSNGTFIVDDTEGKVSKLTENPGIVVDVQSSFSAYTLTAKLKLQSKGGTNIVLGAMSEEDNSLQIRLFGDSLNFGVPNDDITIDSTLLDTWATVHLVFNNIDKGNNLGDGLLYINGALHTTFTNCWVDGNPIDIYEIEVAYVDETGSEVRVKNLALFDRVLTEAEIQTQV